MKTLIHVNLHNGKYAITQRGVVVGYCSAATLVDWDAKEDAKKASFSRSGNKRTVHLWCRGTLVHVTDFEPLKGRQVLVGDCPGCDDFMIQATYNPKRGDQGFTTREFGVVSGGNLAVFDDEGMWVS